ncbi:hypothetical protein Lal_00023794 [Lupinus albus]|uniref:RING-type E3 ubiquitin transferase n=1 Tax=Lupinus albus TaxID=3870 RepID=A0A6A4PIX9_LUPAL|nr:putative transcription factor C2H2 family [Lupinus albus]KAF1887786.1 hypothetical protein Lal_00023794 [Lupinus albus]
MENVDPNIEPKKSKYALSGEKMLICTVVLLIVILVMICIHLYVRWYLLRIRHRRSHNHNHQNGRSRFVFYIDPALTTTSRGLEASVIATLPVFTFSPNSEAVECAVCLSEFEDGESGRVLPKCKHSFHIECIDMWFESHSTCPICRVHVEAPPQPEVVVNVSEPGSSSELNRTGVAIYSSSSFVSLGTETDYDSASPSSFRSPMMSFKRILSRGRKSSLVVERGGEETLRVDSECNNEVTNLESK